MASAVLTFEALNPVEASTKLSATVQEYRLAFLTCEMNHSAIDAERLLDLLDGCALGKDTVEFGVVEALLPCVEAFETNAVLLKAVAFLMESAVPALFAFDDGELELEVVDGEENDAMNVFEGFLFRMNQVFTLLARHIPKPTVAAHPSMTVPELLRKRSCRGTGAERLESGSFRLLQCAALVCFVMDEAMEGAINAAED